MLGVELKPGQVVELELAKSKDEIMQFRTLIEAVRGDDQLTLLAPMYKAMPYPFRDEDIIDLIYTVHDEENTPTTYTFKVRATERYRVDELTYLNVEKVSSITKLQRRGFYRLNYVTDMQYEILQEKNEGTSSELYPIVTKDISAGGFRGIVEHQIPVGTQLLLHLKLGEEIFPVKAQVIDSGRFDESFVRSEIRGTFIGLTSKKTCHLIQAINQMQAEYINRMSGAGLEERLKGYHTEMLYSERRVKRDWVVRWLDWSVVVTWVITFVIMANYLLAMPQRPNTIDRYYGYTVRLNWDMERIRNNIYFLLALFVITSISVILNSTRMKRADDRYRQSLVVMGILSLIMILAYLFYF